MSIANAEGELPTLHFLCGKAASGKSTLSKELGEQANTVVISEDHWLSVLFGDQMSSLQDYLRFSARLKEIMMPHVVSLLEAGVSVVLDFPANTVESRRWMIEILKGTDVTHIMHFLDVSDEVCKKRVRERNESGDHPFRLSEEQFDKLARHFSPPTKEEGFNVIRYKE
ncbi:MAG: ATP-binding protein [Rhizobiaceae bacterium]|nr:ATP-binding protein [Rhizobiaceae bacterium]